MSEIHRNSEEFLQTRAEFAQSNEFTKFIGKILNAGVTEIELAERYDTSTTIIRDWRDGDGFPAHYIMLSVIEEYSYALEKDTQ